MFTLGIDVGTASTRAAVVADGQQLRALRSVRTGSDLEAAAERVRDEVLTAAGLDRDQVDYTASTGFGRSTVGYRDIQMTDLTAHGQGARFLFPATRTVLDIGAQSTRAMRIAASGQVQLLRMNDKCAAGAGTFLVRVAKYLELSIEEIGALAVAATEPQQISSVCAVLAESEIINHVTAGKRIEDILKGAMVSIASRAQALVKRVGIEQEVTLTGGIGLNPGMRLALQECLGQPINFDLEKSPYAGAIGAAVLARRRLALRGADGTRAPLAA
ncbi:MAG: acyl-CoA dehydratase activase [Burkholderiaceae bacterium]